jgi:hypothetical protein
MFSILNKNRDLISFLLLHSHSSLYAKNNNQKDVLQLAQETRDPLIIQMIEQARLDLDQKE